MTGTAINLGGWGYQSLGFDNEPLIRDIQLRSESEGFVSASADIYAEGQWNAATLDFNYQGEKITKGILKSSNGRYFTELIGGSLGSLSAYSASDDPFSYVSSIEQGMLSENNSFIGSKQGGSVIIRLLGGEDYAELHGGADNFLNTNSGADDIVVYGGGGRVLGGSENDNITIYGGNMFRVNGNRGEDYIVNWADLQIDVRGGSEDDTIVSAGGSMNAYGDLGADTFKPLSGGFMVVKDYQAGIDKVDLSGLGANYSSRQGKDGLVVAIGGNVVMLLEGVGSF